MDNPFATPAQPETNITTTKENKNMTETNNDGISLTYKCGAGFDAPWIVARAETVAEAKEIAQSPELKELMDAVAAGGQYFAGLAKPAPAASGGGRPGQPQGSQTPPAGAPDCPPGWTYKSGTSKAGKAYQGFFPPRGDESKPIFF